MFFNHPYVDLSGPGLLPDPPDMHRSSQFGFNEQHDFRRGDESVSVDHFNQFDPDCGGLFHGSTGGPGLPSTNIVDYDHMRAGTFEYGHEQEIGQPHIGHTPDVGYYAHDQVPLEMEELGQGEFGRFREDAGRAHDIRQCSVSDRERDRDRNRRVAARERQRQGRSDDIWDRGSRRDYGERDWSSDRRRDRREREIARDRSPRKDSNGDIQDCGESIMEEEYAFGNFGDSHYRDLDVDRDRDRYRDRIRDRDSDRERERMEREGERWMTEEPSATILLRGVNNAIVENDVIQELIRVGMAPKDVRFMRRITGASRGFGFVEFRSQTEAQRWMDLNQGVLAIPGMDLRLTMHYSAPRVGRNSIDHTNRLDWLCKCGAHNFKRREFCYKCNNNRRFVEDPLCGVTELDPLSHIGKNPCNSLLYRDLDALTTEQGVLQAIASLTSLPVKNCRVIRDDMNTSLCFAFVELNSVASAKQLHDFLQVQCPPMTIDGKQVNVSYARNTFNTSIDIINRAQHKLAQNQYYLNYSYYNQDYHYPQAPGSTAVDGLSGTSTNAAAAVAQTAIMQAQAAKSLISASPTVTATSSASTTQENIQYPVYPAPDVSSYQYDKTSGYYYDPSTGLYYEPNTQYYYNSKASQWLYWDAEKSTYLPAPSQGSDDGVPVEAGASAPAEKTSEKEEKKEKEKSKVAKKIAKDMEKWAKAMNAQKDAIKEELKKGSCISARKESAAADAGFSIMQKSKDDMKFMPPPPAQVTPSDLAPSLHTSPPATVPPANMASKTCLVASYGGDSDDSGDDEDGALDESRLVDWTKLACLLCKRQFQSRDILAKHNQFSDLHKQNIENLKAKSAAGRVEKKEYRDRAKERRRKYGAPVPPEPPQRQAVVDISEVYEQPTKQGIGVENIGSQMLQKMGWSAGLGLGKVNQGRVVPVESKRRSASAGLGMQGSEIVTEEGATYKDNVKKTLFARYSEVE